MARIFGSDPGSSQCILLAGSWRDVSHCHEVSFNCLVQVVSARSLHFKMTLSPFVINNYLKGRFFEIMQIYCFCVISSAH